MRTVGGVQIVRAFKSVDGGGDRQGSAGAKIWSKTVQKKKKKIQKRDVKTDQRADCNC